MRSNPTICRRSICLFQPFPANSSTRRQPGPLRLIRSITHNKPTKRSPSLISPFLSFVLPTEFFIKKPNILDSAQISVTAINFSRKPGKFLSPFKDQYFSRHANRPYPLHGQSGGICFNSIGRGMQAVLCWTAGCDWHSRCWLRE